MSAQVSLELHHRISQFLYHEASLLDDWKFRDWLAQLDEEIRYTMRVNRGAHGVTKRFVTPCAPRLTHKRATAAKAFNRRQPGFLMTPKTSWSGESRVWKRAWPGRKSRRHAPVT